MELKIQQNIILLALLSRILSVMMYMLDGIPVLVFHTIRRNLCGDIIIAVNGVIIAKKMSLWLERVLRDMLLIIVGAHGA